MKNLFYKTIIIVSLCGACSQKGKDQPTTEATLKAAPAEVTGPMAAQATMKPAKKQKAKGVVHFTQSGDRIKVEANLEGVKPGPHGFHIHENGDCSAPDFSSAGGHYNPTQKPHGDHTSEERHVGDMGNIVADRKGKATLSIELSRVSIGGPAGILGKAVILHEKADDLKTQPTGNAGGRIACGVIEALN